MGYRLYKMHDIAHVPRLKTTHQLYLLQNYLIQLIFAEITIFTNFSHTAESERMAIEMAVVAFRDN